MKDPNTFKGWQDTGRFVPAELFILDHPDETLHKDCTDVVVYNEGLYIQALKGDYFYMSCKSKSLDDIENILWLIKSKV
jgi:hypothetical protein|tara:strand:+ start:6564 stop:6800 length:237 start_codon:yes stop_codon:yes gene_type:complete